MSCGHAEVSWDGDNADLLYRIRTGWLQVEDAEAGVEKQPDGRWRGYAYLPYDGPEFRSPPRTRQEAISEVERWWHKRVEYGAECEAEMKLGHQQW